MSIEKLSYELSKMYLEEHAYFIKINTVFMYSNHTFDIDTDESYNYCLPHPELFYW